MTRKQNDVANKIAEARRSLEAARERQDAMAAEILRLQR